MPRIATVRRLLASALTRTGLTGPGGAPLHYTLHDFRRMFLTDVIMSGLPPHIAGVAWVHVYVLTCMSTRSPEAVAGRAEISDLTLSSTATPLSLPTQRC